MQFQQKMHLCTVSQSRMSVYTFFARYLRCILIDYLLVLMLIVTQEFWVQKRA